MIGSSTEVSAVDASNQTVIGTGAVGVSNNTVTLGNTSVDGVYAATDGDAVVYCGGINMSNNQPAAASGTMSNETLDHYEEGITAEIDFNPGGGGTMGQTLTHTMSYTKIGRCVFISGAMHNNQYDGGAGSVTLSGLPFTNVGDLTEYAEFGTLWVQLDGTSADGIFAVDIRAGATGGVLLGADAGTWDTDVDIRISGFYITAT